MPRIVRTERYRRGFFGWLFRIVFWIFNAIMLAWVCVYWGLLSGVHVETSNDHAAKLGMALGGAIGTGMIMVFWAIGAFILGLLVLFTRGKKIIVEDYE